MAARVRAIEREASRRLGSFVKEDVMNRLEKVLYTAKVVAETEKDGQLVENISSQVLTPTAFSAVR